MTPLFEIRNLSAGYDVPRVHDISFAAEAGEIIGILGRNGCGKTTLLRGIAGSIRRFSGEVSIDGQSCAALKPRQLSKLLSILPQKTELLPGILAREIMEMGRYPHDSLFREVSRDTSRRVRECACALGIEQLLDQDCARLSQGQQQLVLLGRLLVQDTPVMLLDEPNATLDYGNTHTMFAKLSHLVHSRRKTALVVLHDPELALAYCHRILFLKDGKLIRDLCPAEAGQDALDATLKQLYPHTTVRKDPFDGRFRCYHQTN